MPKFAVTYSVNQLFETIIDAKDKDEALSVVCGRGGENGDTLLVEEFLGVNLARDVTHEYPEDGKPKTKNPRKVDRTH
jgi:NAD(P)H-hydrate repair Nnr-like enzyme with NAD(P)H-hydrate epimerase domain